MSIETKIICDVCGAVRGETNHWFSIYTYPATDGVLMIRQFATDRPEHVCGQQCAHALLDRWLATGMLVERTDDLPTAMPQTETCADPALPQAGHHI